MQQHEQMSFNFNEFASKHGIQTDKEETAKVQMPGEREAAEDLIDQMAEVYVASPKTEALDID